MYCYNCGKEIDDKAVVCVQCGCSVTSKYTMDDDKSSALLAILCFLIPVFGLIMYLIYDNKSPRRAKSVGKAALAGFIITRIVLSVILALLYFDFVGIFALVAYTVSV